MDRFFNSLVKPTHATKRALVPLKRGFFGLVAAYACIAAQSAFACNISVFQCTPVTNAGSASYDATTTCTIRIARPSLDTACSALSAGLSYVTGRGIVMTATAANTANWGQITVGPTLNDVPGRKALITGTVPLGGESTMVVALRVQGACGTSTSLVASISDAILRQSSVSQTFSLPVCPAAATATPTATATLTATSGGGTSTPTPQPTLQPTSTPTPGVVPGGISLSLDGIYDNGDGTFTAYIGYNNTSGRDITITAGLNGSAKNFFSPNPANRGQTSTFLTGNHPGAIVTLFGGVTTTYTVGAEGTTPVSVTFSGTSVPKLAAVEPLSQCVISGSDGNFAAVMGYNNPNKFDILLKVGAANKFEPGSANRGQPEKFVTGLNNAAFTLLALNSELTWKLATKSTLVKPTATECTCPAVGGASIRTQLNADALAMNQLAEKSAALILSVGTDQAKKSSTDVKKRTTSNLAAIKAATVKIPNVFVTCPANETPPQCKRVDNQSSINSLNAQFDIALHIVKRGTARGNFLKTGKTKPANGKTDPLVVEANKIYDRAKAELKKYPRYNTSCTKK